MRSLAVAAIFVRLGAGFGAGLGLCAGACGSAPPRAPQAPAVPEAMTPAHDLAGARSEAPPPDRHGDPGLTEKGPRVVDLDILRITAHAAPGGEPELTAVASADLFKQAGEAAKAGRPRDAIATYRQLVAEFPESQFAPVALFNIAALDDIQGDLTATLTALEELVARYPATRESIDGHLYIAALQADHARWADAAKTLAAILARTSLTFVDRIEAFARKGYVELELGQLDAAEASLSAAVAEWRKAPRIDDPYYIAMAHYYRGELMHRRFAAAQVRGGDDEMIADLDAKRALAGMAYDRWRESLRFHQAYWATAAGYQMSQIFVELWEAHVRAPYPHRVEAATRPTYVADVHLRVRRDLEKALEGHRMNVELARAFGVETPWSKGSERQAVAIMELLAQDAAGRYVAPSS
jgi:predicted negative regulator of RcsB-dependent stress response